MAVKYCPLRIDVRQQEIDNRGTPMFPCGGYTVAVGSQITGFIPWHWHEEVEVLIVTKGVLKLAVPSHSLVVREGEAAFINSSVLHTAVNINNSDCKIKSLVFDPQLIFGSLASAIDQKYVRPLINCPKLRMIHFQNNRQWHKAVIEDMVKAFGCYEEEAFGYELFVRDYLSKMWFLIVLNQQKELAQHQNSNNAEALRVKGMLSYIHAHYKEPISLKSISDSAAVSSRECLRCFNHILGTTPMKYLLNYRISVAAGLLTNSALNITEICKLSGFDSPSYFSLKFKALTERTPREYRQQNKKADC